MLRVLLLSLLVVWLPACSDDDNGGTDSALLDGGDGGTDQASPPADQGPGEGLALDQGAGDGPVSSCDPALDLAPLTLDPGYCVTRRFALNQTADAVGLQGENIYLFSLASGSGTVQQATIDAQTGAPGAFSPVFSFTPALSGTLYPGSYLALGPGGVVAVGYTQDQTFDGQIVWGNKGIKTPKLVDKAAGNFDAVLLDASTLLVNGTGLGTAQDGQGVYLYQDGQTPRLLIKELGVASGFMALGNKVLFAGGYFSDGSKIYGFSLAEVQAAVSGNTTLTSSADGDLVHQGSAGDVTAVGNDLVLTKLDSNWQFESVVRLPVTVSSDKVTPKSEQQLVTIGGGSTTLTVSGLASAGKRLGLVLQGTSKTELALVEPK